MCFRVGTHVGVAATGAPHGVDFVDEHYTGRLFLGLAEQVADARCTDAHKHFHEVTAGH